MVPSTVKTALLAACALLLCSCACRDGYSFSWQRHVMDGHRTGVTAPSADNVSEALGTVDGEVYTAPNGVAFPKGSATYAVAQDMIAVQPQMAPIKEVIAHATRDMVAAAPESELSNWWVDRMMVDVAALTRRKVDVGILNFGGIRVNLAAGDVLLDDIVSMFPFKNNLVFVALKGSDLAAVFDAMAATRPQVVGGVKVVMDGHRIDTLLVGGKPVDPARTYGVATVDFLLDGGDGLSVGKNAKELIQTNTRVIDAVLSYVRRLGAEGKPLEYFTDGRMVVKNWEE